MQIYSCETYHCAATSQLFSDNPTQPVQLGMNHARLLMSTVDAEQFITHFIYHR